MPLTLDPKVVKCLDGNKAIYQATDKAIDEVMSSDMSDAAKIRTMEKILLKGQLDSGENLNAFLNAILQSMGDVKDPDADKVKVIADLKAGIGVREAMLKARIGALEAKDKEDES
jgi:hypothetical protein